MAPMVIALLSAVFLREGLGWRRGFAIVAGFAGVVVAVHPWSEGGRAAHEWDWVGCGGLRGVRGLLLSEYGVVAGADEDGGSRRVWRSSLGW